MLRERSIDHLLVTRCKNSAGAAEGIVGASPAAVTEHQISRDPQRVLRLLHRKGAARCADVQAAKKGGGAVNAGIIDHAICAIARRDGDAIPRGWQAVGAP